MESSRSTSPCSKRETMFSSSSSAASKLNCSTAAGDFFSFLSAIESSLGVKPPSAPGHGLWPNEPTRQGHSLPPAQRQRGPDSAARQLRKAVRLPRSNRSPRDAAEPAGHLMSIETRRNEDHFRPEAVQRREQ